METLVKQQIAIKTEVLQEMVSKVVKACSMVEAFPLTGLLELTCKENTLTITGTDNINTLTLSKSPIEGQLNATVDARLFSALIAKLTTPLTSLSIENGILTVNANGKYDFKVVTEEDGSLVHIPTAEFNFEVPSNHITNEDLRTILTMNKSAKAEVKEMPSIFNYYTDSERVLTTDLYRACTNPVKLFNNPVCLTPELVELISLVCDDGGVNIKENDDKVCFSSSNGVLIGRKAIKEDLENFPVEALIESLNDQFTYNCVISRTTLMNALDRICLFTNGLTINAVNLKFEKDQITLTTDKSNSSETIKFLQGSTIEDSFDCCIDGGLLKSQLAAIAKEDLVIKFGSENGIQLVCDKVLQTLGFYGDEE